MKPNHIPDKAWETALKLLKTAPAKWGNGNKICAGTYIQADGTITTHTYLAGYVCHAYVSRPYGHCPLLFDTQTADHRQQADEPANLAFFKWLVSRSPVRKFILNETFDSVHEGGLIIDVLRAGPRETLWMCKAVRAMHEDTYRVPLWFKLVNGGVHPMLALVTAQCLSSTLTSQRGTTHCSCMMPPSTQAELKNLLTIDHLPIKKLKELPQTGLFSAEWTTSLVFNNTATWGQLLPLDLKSKKVKVDDGWGGYFEKEVGTTCDALLEALIKLQKEYS